MKPKKTIVTREPTAKGATKMESDGRNKYRIPIIQGTSTDIEFISKPKVKHDEACFWAIVRFKTQIKTNIELNNIFKTSLGENPRRNKIINTKRI